MLVSSMHFVKNIKLTKMRKRECITIIRKDL